MHRHDGRSGSRARHLAVAVLLVAGALAAAPSSSDTVTLTVLATNDVHNQLAPPDDESVGGVAHLAAHFDRVRAQAPEALYVDAGDMTGSGYGIARVFDDEPTIEAMNLLGLDAMAAGNHEFDPGLDHLRRLYGGGCRGGDCAYRHDVAYEGAGFATLSGNVVEVATGEQVLPTWALRQVAGVSVGIVGLTGNVQRGPLDLLAEDGEVAATPIAEAVGPAVDEVVAAGAQVVVLVWHAGSRQHTLGAPDPNGCEGMEGPTWRLRGQLPDAVDLVVDGDTHQSYVCDDPDGPLMTQAGEYGQTFTRATLVVDRATGDVVERRAVNRPVTHDVAPDPELQGLVERYVALGGVDAPDWADLDGDTLGDGFEAFGARSNPRKADTDGDGLTDDREVLVHRTAPRRADTDGGGVDDGAEVAAGTDPRLAVDDGVPGLLDGLGELLTGVSSTS